MSNEIVHEPEQVSSVSLSPISTALANPQQLAELDVSKIEALYALSERDEARRARASYYADFAQMQGELEPVRRAAKNTHTNSQYALLDHIEGMLRPVLHKWGFSYSGGQRPHEQEGWTTYTLRLRHRHGHHEDYDMPLPWDQAGAAGKTNKTLIHALGSSQSYGTRYLLVNTLGVQTTLDDDGVAASRMPPGGRSISASAADEIRRMMAATGVNQDKFFEYFQIATITELPVSRYEEAVRRLNERARLNSQLEELEQRAREAGVTQELLAALPETREILSITPGQLPHAKAVLDGLLKDRDLDGKVEDALKLFDE